MQQPDIAAPSHDDPWWFAVHTRAQQELVADRNLRRKGYYTFFPFDRIRRRRKIAGQDRHVIEWIDVPYFSRYIFVGLFSPQQSTGPINSEDVDGVSTVVRGLTGTPLRIPTPVIQELMTRGEPDAPGLMRVVDLVERKKFETGAMVQFRDNTPLAGLIAEVALDAGKEVRLFLDVLGARREISAAPSAIAEIADMRRAVGR